MITKSDFIKLRTKIVTKMIESRDETGINPTTVCFAELDDIYDLMVPNRPPSNAQTLRDNLVIPMKRDENGTFVMDWEG